MISPVLPLDRASLAGGLPRKIRLLADLDMLGDTSSPAGFIHNYLVIDLGSA
jgi:hypothetical protein